MRCDPNTLGMGPMPFCWVGLVSLSYTKMTLPVKNLTDFFKTN